MLIKNMFLYKLLANMNIYSLFEMSLKSLIVCILIVYPSNAKLKTITYIENGGLQGKIMKNLNGNDFVAFISIPYAKAPVGNLRFKVAQAADNWPGVLNATKDVPICVQYLGSIAGQEDCLYLNVFTQKITNSLKSLKPVMVFIHGGGFVFGSSSIDSLGPQFLLTEDIVLVTFNYRLGALGFLSLDDKSAGFSTNNGLKDQVAALKWVQRNIAQFGGNPKQVTIFGESAGAASVDFLMLSPLTKGLFHKAIIQSGAAIAPWANGPTNTALQFAKVLNIENFNSSYFLEELQKLSIQKIIEAQNILQFDPVIYKQPIGSPAIEGPGDDSFLPEHPRNILKSGNFNRVPFMMGYNNKEGIMFDLIFKMNGIQFVFEPKRYIPYYFDLNKSAEISKRQLDQYFNGTPPTDSKDMINFWTDGWFKYDVVETVQKHSTFADKNIYLYEFSMDTKLNSQKRKNAITATYPGASHADDLGYIFGMSDNPAIERRSIEEICVKRMVKLWTNFAKYGNPTPGKNALLNNQIWLPFKSSQSGYMSLGNQIKFNAKYADAGFQFWKSLYQDYDIFV